MNQLEEFRVGGGNCFFLTTYMTLNCNFDNITKSEPTKNCLVVSVGGPGLSLLSGGSLASGVPSPGLSFTPGTGGAIWPPPGSGK